MYTLHRRQGITQIHNTQEAGYYPYTHFVGGWEYPRYELHRRLSMPEITTV